MTKIRSTFFGFLLVITVWFFIMVGLADGLFHSSDGSVADALLSDGTVAETVLDGRMYNGDFELGSDVDAMVGPDTKYPNLLNTEHSVGEYLGLGEENGILDKPGFINHISESEHLSLSDYGLEEGLDGCIELNGMTGHQFSEIVTEYQSFRLSGDVFDVATEKVLGEATEPLVDASVFDGSVIKAYMGHEDRATLEMTNTLKSKVPGTEGFEILENFQTELEETVATNDTFDLAAFLHKAAAPTRRLAVVEPDLVENENSCCGAAIGLGFSVIIVSVGIYIYHRIQGQKQIRRTPMIPLYD